MRNLLAHSLIPLTLLSGCGSTLFAVTPRSEPMVADVTRIVPTYSGMPAVRHELHQQRKKSILPALLGTVVDAVAFTALVSAAGDDNDGQPALVFTTLGATVLALDLYLVSSRSVIDEPLAPAWMAMPQGTMVTPSQAAGSAMSVTCPSFESRAPGSSPVIPICTPDVMPNVSPAAGPSATTPVEVVVPND